MFNVMIFSMHGAFSKSLSVVIFLLVLQLNSSINDSAKFQLTSSNGINTLQRSSVSFLSHSCQYSSACFRERNNDCSRCFHERHNLDSCHRFALLSLNAQSSSRNTRSTIIGISNHLRYTRVDVQSLYCVGFNALMFSSSPKLNIGTVAYINSRGTEFLFKDELISMGSGIIYIHSKLISTSVSRFGVQRHLSTAQRLPTHVQIFVYPKYYIRQHIIDIAIKKLARKPNWDDAFETDTDKFTIIRKSNLQFLIYIPFKEIFSQELRRR